MLAHGPTFMGNPLAAAVANASIDLLLAQDWAAEVARIEAGLRAGLAPAGDLPGVADVRVLGAIGVVQLDHEVDVAAASRAAAERGVWLRPFRDLVYTMPPYVTGDDDLARDRRRRGRRGGRWRRHPASSGSREPWPTCADRDLLRVLTYCAGPAGPRGARSTGSRTCCWPPTTTSGSPTTRRWWPAPGRPSRPTAPAPAPRGWSPAASTCTAPWRSGSPR